MVNVDQHDDLRFIPEYKIQRLREYTKKGLIDEINKSHDRGANSLFTVADFIFAAYKLGIIKKLYWVSPSGFLEWDDIEKGAAAFLRAFGYSEDIIKTFKKDGKVVKGKIFGLEVVLTSIRNLPHIKEPVLFSVDVDYFPNAIRKKKKRDLEFFKEFFYYLREKNIHIRDLGVAYSVNGGYTEAVYRYIGDELIYLLKHPEIASSGDFPEVWRYRERGFVLFRKGQYSDAMKVFSEALLKYPDEPSLIAGKAAVLVLSGEHKEALPLIKGLIETFPEYSYLYVYLGRILGDRKDLRGARGYLEEFLKIQPASYYGLITYGNVLYDNDRDHEALVFYNKILTMYEDVNAYMYGGDALFHLKRFQEAREYYLKGLGLLNEVGYRSLRNYPESVRNMRYLGLM